MLSFQVTSLFTNVPLAETNDIILRRIYIDMETGTIPKPVTSFYITMLYLFCHFFIALGKGKTSIELFGEKTCVRLMVFLSISIWSGLVFHKIKSTVTY